MGFNVPQELVPCGGSVGCSGSQAKADPFPERPQMGKGEVNITLSFIY